MRQRSILFLAAPTFAFIMALVAVVAIFLNISFGADASGELKIARVELGFNNYFKVGCWTPVRIEVDGVQAGGKQRLEVTVGDSDGVPTPAGAPLLVPAQSSD